MNRAKRKPTGNTDDTLFTKLEREGQLAHRLGAFGAHVFTGTTDEPTRRARVRKAILDHGLEWVICGRTAEGKSCNFAEAFKRVYGEDLKPKENSTC